MRSSPFSFAAPPAAAFTLMKTRIGISLASLGPGAAVPCLVLTAELSSGTVAQAFRPEGSAFSSHGVCFFLRDLCATVSALGVYPDRVGVLSLCLSFNLNFQLSTLLWT